MDTTRIQHKINHSRRSIFCRWNAFKNPEKAYNIKWQSSLNCVAMCVESNAKRRCSKAIYGLYWFIVRVVFFCVAFVGFDGARMSSVDETIVVACQRVQFMQISVHTLKWPLSAAPNGRHSPVVWCWICPRGRCWFSQRSNARAIGRCSRNRPLRRRQLDYRQQSSPDCQSSIWMKSDKSNKGKCKCQPNRVLSRRVARSANRI